MGASEVDMEMKTKKFTTKLHIKFINMMEKIYGKILSKNGLFEKCNKSRCSNRATNLILTELVKGDKVSSASRYGNFCPEHYDEAISQIEEIGEKTRRMFDYYWRVVK